jgi:hypothetical protein
MSILCANNLHITHTIHIIYNKSTINANVPEAIPTFTSLLPYSIMIFYTGNVGANHKQIVSGTRLKQDGNHPTLMDVSGIFVQR